MTTIATTPHGYVSALHTDAHDYVGHAAWWPDGRLAGIVPASDPDPYDTALGLIGRHRPYRANAALYVLARGSWDPHDAWGSGMAYLIAVCDVLYLAGESHLIPAECGYSAPFGVGYSWDDALGQTTDDGTVPWEVGALAQALDADELHVDDLAQAARILNRYLDAVRAAGRDY